MFDKKAYQQEYYKKNKTRIQAKSKEYYEANRGDRQRQARVAYYVQQERAVERSRQWRKNNPEKAADQGLRKHGWSKARLTRRGRSRRVFAPSAWCL